MEKKSTKHIRTALSLNIIFTIVQVFGAIFTNSVALLSEVVRNIGDILSITVSYILEKRSQRRANQEFTYGYARYSILGSILSTFFLIFSSIIVLITTIPRFINPEVVDYEKMFVFALIGLILNGIGTFKTFYGKGINEQAVSLHLLEDLLTWIGVLIVSVIMRVWNVPILDPIVSVIITVFIFRKGLQHLDEAFSIFLEKTPKNISVEKVRKQIYSLANVKDILELHVWTLDGIKDYATIRVLVNKKTTYEEYEKLKEQIRAIFNTFSIEHSTIEITKK